MKKTFLKVILVLVSFALITSCSKKDNKNSLLQNVVTLDSKSISLHYDESHQFSLIGNGNAVISSYNWVSTDVTVGIVDQTGKFAAQKIGTTTIKAVKGNDVIESLVTVLPYSNICKEPYWNFSDNMPATKSKESRALVGQTSTILTYSGENEKVRNVMYIYDANSKMSSAAILLANTTAVINESASFFKERYAYSGLDSNIYFYSDNKNVIIGVTVDPILGFVAIYIPYSTSKVNAINTETILDIVKGVRKVQ